MRPISGDAIIIKDEKILLIRRMNEPFKGMWALPGGIVEEDETIEQCIVREAKEETGLGIKLENFVGIYSEPSRDPRKIITVVYICGITGGNPKAGSDAEDIKWFDLENLPELAADHKKIIKNLLK